MQCSKHAFQPRMATSPNSLSWAKSHMIKCVIDHTKCSGAVVAALPHRILRLAHKLDGTIQVRIEEPKGKQAIYACLSHRWGGSESCMATRVSYSGLLDEVPWSSIPPTFQDAIRFTLALGIKYIWIDSLCIIQDDPLDWQEQAGHMASIYQNSFITLAATSSGNNESGCFWNLDTEYERNFLTDAGLMSVRKTLKHWERIWTSNSASAFPLLSRAWVFQERLLAPRVLHFSSSELIWECMELGNCECGQFDPLSNPKLHDWTSEKSWQAAVELFSALELTYEHDRLPALLGFARYYAKSAGFPLDSAYMAGSWKETMHTDILWRVESVASTLREGKPLLCRCFDLMNSGLEQSLQWRCEYSYSAACSIQCLQERKLCRYAKSAAASVSLKSIWAGSCSGQDATTSISDLRSSYKQESKSLLIDDSTYPGPSWSWTSSHTRIKYFPDVAFTSTRGRNFSSPCQIDSIQVLQSGQHLTSQICSAKLTLQGWISTFVLEYGIHRRQDDENASISQHDIFSYRLRSGSYSRLMDFYPDYAMCLEGPRWIPQGSRVLLLHVTSGVHLVLIEKDYFALSLKHRIGRLAIGSFNVEDGHAGNLSLLRYGWLGDATNADEVKFVRIGVMRSPRISERETYWRTSWAEHIEIL